MQAPRRRRVPIPKKTVVGVLTRDNRPGLHCMRAMFSGPALHLQVPATTFPERGHYHRNAPTGATAESLGEPGTAADHVVPVADGGTDDAANLVKPCCWCDMQKRDTPVADHVPARTPAVRYRAVPAGRDGLVAAARHLSLDADSPKRFEDEGRLKGKHALDAASGSQGSSGTARGAAGARISGPGRPHRHRAEPMRAAPRARR